LQHLIYCERQAALIHVEQVWLENVWTVEGSQLHETVIGGESESRRDVRIARDLALRSLRLGLTGRGDVVEFNRVTPPRMAGVRILDWPGLWRPYPIEYKRGSPKHHRADEVQLCAQAICLEEMLGVTIEEGALFYGQTRHRRPVPLAGDLRALTESAALRLREIVESRITPKAVYEPSRCDECSLLALCRPRAVERCVGRYLKNAVRVALADQGQ